MKFLSAAERLAAIDRSTVTFSPNRCLHSQDKFSECTACFGICPAEAITPGKPPVLNTEKCLTCLACLPACPTGAYQADDAVPALLNCAGRLENGAVELICEHHPTAENGPRPEAVGVRVRGCLAGLGTGAYMTLIALGLEKIIVRTDACWTCPWAALHAEIDSQIRQAQRLLAPWKKSETLAPLPVLESTSERPLWDADNPPLSRRDLFRMAAHQGKIAVARAIENGQRTPGRSPNRDRMRILGAVEHLPVPEMTRASLEGMGFGWITVSEDCTACGVCARACPTGALFFEQNEDENTYTLTFSARKCIGCDICVHICIPGAVTVNQNPDFTQVIGMEAVDLREGRLARCEYCKSLYAAQPDGHLCPQCTVRRDNPFGTKMPFGFRPGRPNQPEEHS